MRENIKAALAMIFIGMVLATVLFYTAARDVTARNSVPTTVVKCWEDQPCWRCETMGNHVCGRD